MNTSVFVCFYIFTFILYKMRIFFTFYLSLVFVWAPWKSDKTDQQYFTLCTLIGQEYLWGKKKKSRAYFRVYIYVNCVSYLFLYYIYRALGYYSVVPVKYPVDGAKNDFRVIKPFSLSLGLQFFMKKKIRIHIFSPPRLITPIFTWFFSYYFCFINF